MQNKDRPTTPPITHTETKITKILLINTGGTFGMKRTDKGLISTPGYLGEQLQNFRQFVDKNAPFLKGFKYATPISKYNVRAYYNIIEFTELLDSVNMDYKDWLRIANCIQREYKKYDAFIICHGCDTMCYTASALSFMLQNLSKMIVFCGALLSFSQMGNDAQDNLSGAFDVAMHFKIGEVCIFSKNKLYRANRCMRYETTGFAVFRSTNYPPLAVIGIDPKVDWAVVRKDSGMRSNELVVQPITNPNVACLRLFPGMTVDVLKNFLRPPMSGLVLQSYGAGNVPNNRPEFMEALKEATSKGIIIVNVTQCSKGGVKMDYMSQKVLEEAGVINGYDMTSEAALTKLMYLLSLNKSPEKIKELMQRNLRGELTPEMKENFSYIERHTFMKTVANILEIEAESEQLYEVDRTLLPFMVNALACEGDLKALKTMDDVDFSQIIYDYDHRTPLHVAASSGHLDIVKFLISEGAEVNPIDLFGNTPLFNAITANQLHVAKYLKEQGGKLLLPSTKLGEKLCEKAFLNDLDSLKRYIEYSDADINACDFDSRTALHVAASEGHLEIVQYLISKAANVSLKDREGNTPLMCAERSGHTTIIEFLQQFI